jgi:hypothetical protein
VFKKIKIEEKYKNRFYQRYIVNTKTNCWEWSGTKLSNGYGSLRANKNTFLAHRVSFSLFNDLEEFDVIDHICNNRSCVNPEHLQEVTLIQNWQLGIQRKRERQNLHIHSGKRYSIPRLFFNGICKNGHVISSFSDITAYNKYTLPIMYQCKKCVWGSGKKRIKKY